MKVLIICFALLVCTPILAQDFKAELIAGANVSQIDGDGLAGFDKPGLLAGMAIRYPISDNLYIQPEILYIQKGSRTKQNDPGYFIWRLNYIEIPVVIRYAFHEKFNVQAGVAADVLISSMQDTGAGFLETNNYVHRVSWVSALGFEYAFSERFALNARHMYSLLPFTPYGRMWNNTIAISARLGI